MIKILEEKLEGTLLTVTVEAKLRVTVEEKIKFFESGDVIKLLGEKYEVSGVIKNNRLSNSLRAGGKQKGSWIFEVKQQNSSKKSTPRKTTPRKTAPKKTQPSKKPSTKPSIRGRMSKIAKEKITKNQTEQ